MNSNYLFLDKMNLKNYTNKTLINSRGLLIPGLLGKGPSLISEVSFLLFFLFLNEEKSIVGHSWVGMSDSHRPKNSSPITA